MSDEKFDGKPIYRELPAPDSGHFYVECRYGSQNIPARHCHAIWDRRGAEIPPGQFGYYNDNAEVLIRQLIARVNRAEHLLVKLMMSGILTKYVWAQGPTTHQVMFEIDGHLKATGRLTEYGVPPTPEEWPKNEP